jgi:adenylate cyclase
MVQVQLSNALSDYIGDLEAKVAHLESALELDPNLATAWHWAGWDNIWLGNHKTAFDYFQRMLRLSPLDPASGGAKTGSAYSCLLQGRYEEAAVWADRALLDHPEHPGAHGTKLPSSHTRVVSVIGGTPDVAFQGRDGGF